MTVHFYLPPFRRLVGALPGLRLTSIYTDPFEPFLHEQNKHRAWDIDALKSVALHQTGPVLDLGTGRGRIALPLTEAGLSVTAIDDSETALRHLRATAPGSLTVVSGDITAPPDELTGRFSTAILGDIAINMFATEQALRSFLRAAASTLRPGGVLCIPVLTAASLKTYERRNEITLTPFTDQAGRQHLVHAAMHYDPNGPYFCRTLFLQEGHTPEGEVVAHLAGVREHLWTAEALAPHLAATGLTVGQRRTVPVGPNTQADILVLAADDANPCLHGAAATGRVPCPRRSSRACTRCV